MFAVQFLRFLVLSMKENSFILNLYAKEMFFYKNWKTFFVFSSKKQNHNVSLRLFTFLLLMIMSLMRLCWNSTQKGSLQLKDPFKSVPRWHSLSFGGNKTFLRREAQRRETFQHRLGICQCDPERETRIITHNWITRALLSLTRA